jgi:hypothetical protein
MNDHYFSIISLCSTFHYLQLCTHFIFKNYYRMYILILIKVIKSYTNKKPPYTNKNPPPFHVIIKKLRDNYNLKWLVRVQQMSYHRFSNLGQAFQGDLDGKLIKNIRSEDYADLECNCNITSKVKQWILCIQW